MKLRIVHEIGQFARSFSLAVSDFPRSSTQKQVFGGAQILSADRSVKRCLSLVVLQIKLRAKAEEEAHCRGLVMCSSNVKRCVSIGICSVDVSAIPRLVTSQFKYNSLVAILSGSVQKLSAISVTDSTSNLHCLEQVVQEVSIVVIHGVLEALALFTLAAEPFSHERLMVSTRKLLAMLEQDSETLELVREACEHKCAEHSILAHAADRVTRAW